MIVTVEFLNKIKLNFGDIPVNFDTCLSEGFSDSDIDKIYNIYQVAKNDSTTYLTGSVRTTIGDYTFIYIKNEENPELNFYLKTRQL